MICFGKMPNFNDLPKLSFLLLGPDQDFSYYFGAQIDPHSAIGSFVTSSYQPSSSYYNYYLESYNKCTSYKVSLTEKGQREVYASTFIHATNFLRKPDFQDFLVIIGHN